MKSNGIPFQPANDLERKIRELIEWYNENATRKEDDYIAANLKLVILLAKNVEYSEDLIFIEKIVDTFCDIIRRQREVIRELEDESNYSLPDTVPSYSYSSSCDAPDGNYINDSQIRAAFTAYMGKEEKSLSTASDYISRVQNVWRSFYSDYNEGKLPKDLADSVTANDIYPEHPLLNAYYYIEELYCYVSMKIASSGGNRNWTNNRAALNMFGKALFKDKYKKVKSERVQTQGKDFSKYLFEGKTYGKSRLVLAVVRKYVEDFTPSTFDELKKAFPDDLQGSLGGVRLINDVSDKYKGIDGVKRYFVNTGEMIRMPSGEQVIVCTQWGAQNTERFVEYATDEFDYEIEKI